MWRSLALLLVGCWQPIGPNYPIDRLPEYRVAWLEAGLPDPGECRVRVAWASTADVQRLCRAPEGTRVYGCLKDNQGHWLALADESSPRVVPHEVGHALSACSGMGLDPGHADQRVWCDYLRAAGGVHGCGGQVP